MKLVKFIVIFFIIISIVISSYCLILIIKDMKEEETNESDLIELENTIIEEKEDNKIIDWNELKSINEDIVAWIVIENTPVNYPILKDSNNLYYLKHNFNKKYNSKLNYEGRISYYKSKSNIDTKNIDDTGKIIKLSTCSYINAKTTPTDQRYYVIAMMKEVE